MIRQTGPNILLLTNKSPWPPRDGGAYATLAMARGLSRAGARLTVFAMNTSKHRILEEDIPEKISQEFELHLVRVSTSLNLLKVALDLFTPGTGYVAQRFLNRNYRKALHQLLSVRSFDYIQIEGLYMSSYIRDIRHRSNGKIVFRPHNLEHEIWRELAVREKNPLLKPVLKTIAGRVRKFESKTINNYDLIVPITQRDEQAFMQLGNSKPSKFCPSGVNPGELTENIPNLTCEHIFYLGALDWRPNQEGLLWFISHVWPELRKKHPGLMFCVAGRNAPDWLISKFTAQGIMFEGEVEDSAEFMNRGGIMVVPLFSGSGLRIKILEAMAHGIPVIATHLAVRGLHADLLQYMVLADAPQQFADQIAGILGSPQKSQNMARHARNLVIRDFDNFALTRELLEFYKDHP